MHTKSGFHIPVTRMLGLFGCFISLLFAFAVAAAEPASGNASEFVTARTTAGAVRGKVSNEGAVEVFMGIPYAAPPTGERRFKAPVPPESWTGTRDALQPGSPCPQSGRLASTNEDCLLLNVTKPRGSKRNLPVMVFIHGGGQRVGVGYEHNGDWLVTRGAPVVYVSINHRLNIFAFFAHKQLTAEDPKMGSGDYAALDQIQALRWVRDNIANFGGNPKNVTIFGESGGAQAVCLLMTSPVARGLFHRAISESAPCQWQYYPTLAASEAKGAEIAAQLGCTEPNPLPCLTALPASAILAKESGAQTDTAAGQPAWGGGVFPLSAREAFATGQMNKVPLMQGSNRDEGAFQLAGRFDGGGKPLTAEQYPTVLKDFLGQSRVAAVMTQYPLADYSAPIYALIAALSDSGMVTNNRIGHCNLYLANQLASPHIPAYAYEFADRTAPYPAPIWDAPGNLVAAAHTKELSYLFRLSELTPAQRKISDAMIKYWTQFAATGKPDVKGLPAWPAFKPDRQMVMKFDSDKVGADTEYYARHKCGFWAEQGFGLLYGPYPTPTLAGPVYQ